MIRKGQVLGITKRDLHGQAGCSERCSALLEVGASILGPIAHPPEDATLPALRYIIVADPECHSQGFGWKRWSREWLYGTLGLFSEYRVSYIPSNSAVAPV